MSFKKPENSFRDQGPAKPLSQHLELASEAIIEKRLKSSGKKAREEIFDCLNSESSRVSKSSTVHRFIPSQTAPLKSQNSELFDELHIRRYDRYEDYLPKDRKLNNITPSGENKYSAWAGKSMRNTPSVRATAKDALEEFDLPIYRKHSASRQKRGQQLFSDAEEEGNVEDDFKQNSEKHKKSSRNSEVSSQGENTKFRVKDAKPYSHLRERSRRDSSRSRASSQS